MPPVRVSGTATCCCTKSQIWRPLQYEFSQLMLLSGVLFFWFCLCVCVFVCVCLCVCLCVCVCTPFPFSSASACQDEVIFAWDTDTMMPHQLEFCSLLSHWKAGLVVNDIALLVWCLLLEAGSVLQVLCVMLRILQFTFHGFRYLNLYGDVQLTKYGLSCLWFKF